MFVASYRFMDRWFFTAMMLGVLGAILGLLLLIPLVILLLASGLTIIALAAESALYSKRHLAVEVSLSLDSLSVSTRSGRFAIPSNQVFRIALAIVRLSRWSMWEMNIVLKGASSDAGRTLTYLIDNAQYQRLTQGPTIQSGRVQKIESANRRSTYLEFGVLPVNEWGYERPRECHLSLSEKYSKSR